MLVSERFANKKRWMVTTYHNGRLGLCRRRAAGVVAGCAQRRTDFGDPWRISMFGELRGDGTSWSQIAGLTVLDDLGQ